MRALPECAAGPMADQHQQFRELMDDPPIDNLTAGTQNSFLPLRTLPTPTARTSLEHDPLRQGTGPVRHYRSVAGRR